MQPFAIIEFKFSSLMKNLKLNICFALSKNPLIISILTPTLSTSIKLWPTHVTNEPQCS